VAPRRGAIHNTLLSGGLRFAATTGYFLLTLRVKRTAAAVVLLSGLDLITLVVCEHQVLADADIAQNLASRTRSGGLFTQSTAHFKTQD
jgi:hypothetical protein